MLDTNIVGTVMTADEVGNLYKEYANYWFLFEVLKSDLEGKATLMKLIKYDINKELLRDYLLDHATETKNRFIFVFANPDGSCEII